MPDYSNLTPHQIIELYKSQDIQSLEFSKIRNDLEEGGVAEEDIQIVFRVLDNLKYKNEFRKQSKNLGREYMIVGVIAISAGVIITLITLINAYLGQGTYIVLPYSIILTGIGVLGSILYTRNIKK